MNSALLIGVILIIAGIALAVIAYLVITSNEGDAEDIEMEETDQPLEMEQLESAGIDEEPEQETATGEASPDAGDASIKPSVEPALMDAPSGEMDSEPEDTAAAEPDEPEPESVEADIPARASERIQVATILRDDVTGKLIIQVEGHEYHSPEELRASKHWTKLEYAASDLDEWIRTPEVEVAPTQDIGAEQEGQVAERKPSTMIEQINAILQERIEASGRPELAVRLIEGPDGMVRVLIGVHSYEIAEVPDPEVRELIRQAVSSWESAQ
jgi:hypothetical protein